MVPAFFTAKFTFPAGTDVGVGTRVIGPLVPFVSLTTTLTVVPPATLETVTLPPGAVVVAVLALEELEQPLAATTTNATVARIESERHPAITLHPLPRYFHQNFSEDDLTLGEDLRARPGSNDPYRDVLKSAMKSAAAGGYARRFPRSPTRCQQGDAEQWRQASHRRGHGRAPGL
jgi:hypothetical protein